jgi:hypothetical protein
MARIKHGFHRLLQEGSIFVIEGEDEADNRKIDGRIMLSPKNCTLYSEPYRSNCKPFKLLSNNYIRVLWAGRKL